jgi:hypothetical protein
MKRRKQLEKDADAFDCDLYRLVERAALYFEKSEPNGKSRTRWYTVHSRLVSARAYVREMMHPDDLKGTVG